MTERQREKATSWAAKVAGGDARALEALIPLVYDELRSMGKRYLRRERPGHTLQPTALVHEAFLRLVDQSRLDLKGRTHFLAIAARQMRRVLIDHARAHRAEKRGGDRLRVTLEAIASSSGIPEQDALDLEDSLQELSRLDERQGKIVELRFFGGLTVEEVAEVLGISPKTVEKDWRMARAWLRHRLRKGYDDAP